MSYYRHPASSVAKESSWTTALRALAVMGRPSVTPLTETAPQMAASILLEPNMHPPKSAIRVRMKAENWRDVMDQQCELAEQKEGRRRRSSHD